MTLGLGPYRYVLDTRMKIITENAPIFASAIHPIVNDLVGGDGLTSRLSLYKLITAGTLESDKIKCYRILDNNRNPLAMGQYTFKFMQRHYPNFLPDTQLQTAFVSEHHIHHLRDTTIKQTHVIQGCFPNMEDGERHDMLKDIIDNRMNP